MKGWVALTAVLLATLAAAHPMPHSTVELRRAADGLEATVTIPRSEMEAALRRSVTIDEELEAYLRAHISATAPDGRAVPMALSSISAEGLDHPAVRAVVRFQGPTAALRYDAVTHRIASHYALVYLDGKPLGRLQLPATTLEVPIH